MIKDTLLVSCPGEDGGLFVINGSAVSRLSRRPITGVFSGDGDLIYAYQDDDGKSVRALIDGSALERVLADERMDLHDLLIWDNQIYAAVTESNSVVCFDKDLKRISEWMLPGEHDSAHLNSIAVYQGQVLASVFGRFQRHREYKDATVGLGEVLNIKTGQTFISGLSQPHSLTVVDDLLYLCSSEDKEVRVYRGAELIQKISVFGYARGLAVGSEKIYVGLSLSRNIKPSSKDFNSASIAVIDRSTMELEGFVNIPAREIYDIRIEGLDAWVFPHLINDLMQDQNKLDESLALYKRGYETYLHANTTLQQELDASRVELYRVSQELEEFKKIFGRFKDVFDMGRRAFLFVERFFKNKRFLKTGYKAWLHSRFKSILYKMPRIK